MNDRRPPIWIWIGLIALAAIAALYRSDDGDYWFRLAAGRSILHHGLPAQETWSLAARGQKPWLSEWLFDVTLYSKHAIGGEFAVATWRAAWAAAAMGLAVWILHLLAAATWNSVFLALLVLAVSRDRFLPRPEPLFFVFALLAVALFEHARRTGRDHTRWLIPAQVLWANLQGGWVFGPIIAWLYAALDGLLAPELPEPGTKARPLWRRWAVLGLVLWAASTLLPNPIETISQPMRFLGDVTADRLEDLRRWSYGADRREPFTVLLVLFGIAVLIGGWHTWNASPALTILSLCGLLLGLLSVRFRGFAAWMSLAPLALALRPTGSTYRRIATSMVAITAGIAGLLALVGTPRFVPGIAPDWRSVPVRAVALADSLDLQGPVLNTPRFGGYILWVRGEANPPLVDTRMRGGPGFRGLWERAQTSALSADTLLETWDFSHAVLELPSTPESRLPSTLSRRLEWDLLFYDDTGLLFVRGGRRPELRARAYRYLSADYLTMMDLQLRSFRDAGLRARLEAELERARQSSPYHARASLWLGRLSLTHRDGARAVRLLDEAERLAPQMRGIAYSQGLAHRMVGDEKGARAAFRRALQDPDEAPLAEAELGGRR